VVKTNAFVKAKRTYIYRRLPDFGRDGAFSKFLKIRNYDGKWIVL